jgi:NADH-quinone oxidoreductase subunit G
MCLIDVEEGGRGPDIACNMQARDGLAIRTDTEQVKTMRTSVMEFLLTNHPLDCPICDQSGECRLQDYYMDHATHDSRLADPKMTKPKRVDIGHYIMLDAERCVACTRCVRFGDEVTGTGELRLFHRTDSTEIGMFPGEQLGHDYQGCLADICPVGALTNKDFRFQKRVWYLKESAGVCDGCATGCNISVCHQDNEVFRYLPRRNPEVNKSWICDEGRMRYKLHGQADRALRAKKSGSSTSLEVALAGAAEALQGRTVGVVLGTRATNEANYLLVRALAAQLEGPRFFVVEGNDPDRSESQDTLLIDADKNPNRKGADLLGQVAGGAEGAQALTAALDTGEIDALLVLQDDVLGRLGREGGPEVLIVLSSTLHQSAKAATWLLPITSPVEQDGTWVNRDGRVQRMRRGPLPQGDAQPDFRMVAELAKALGASVEGALGAKVFARLVAEVPGMAGMTYQSLGKEGQALEPVV